MKVTRVLSYDNPSYMVWRRKFVHLAQLAEDLDGSHAIEGRTAADAVRLARHLYRLRRSSPPQRRHWARIRMGNYGVERT